MESLQKRKILDGNGELVILHRGIIENDSGGVVFDYVFEPRTLKEGSYIGLVTADGKYLGKAEFHVTE